MSNCTAGLLSDAADKCAFARLACADTGSGAFGSYVVAWHCAFHGNFMAVLPLGVWMLMNMLALCSTADVWLIPQLNYISELLRLKPDVAGVTLLAFGNGAADVFTSIGVATAHPEEFDYSLMISTQVGATVFIFTVVVGSIIWVAAKHAPDWKLSRMPFFRDSICVVVACLTVLCVSANGTVYAWEALCFLGLYVFYVVLVIVLRYYIQPYWPDDTFGVFVSAKWQTASRAVGSSRIARRAKIVAAPLTRRLPTATFLSNARQGLLGSGAELSSGLPPAAHPPFVSSTSAVAASPAGVPPAGVHAHTPVVPTPLTTFPLPDGGAATPGCATADPIILSPLQSPYAQSDLPIQGSPFLSEDSQADRGSATNAAGAGASTPTAGGGQLVLVDMPHDGGGQPPLPAAPAEEEEEGLAGLDWAEWGEWGFCGRAVFVLELPLSFLRWGTIVSDAQWDERRWRWFRACPPLCAAILTVELCGGVGGAWETRVGSLPIFVFAPLLALPLPWVLKRLTRPDVAPRCFTLLVILGFVMSIVWMDLIATEIIALIETAGLLLRVSPSILGLTVISIANSAGDLVANIAAAKGASAKMAIAACFGAPLLMNLLSVGAGLSMRMIKSGGKPVPSSINRTCRVAFLFLFIAIFSHIVRFPLGGYRATRSYAVYLFVLYAVFVLTALLTEAGALGGFMGG